MKKNKIALLLAALVCVGSLSGCFNNTSKNKEEKLRQDTENEATENIDRNLLSSSQDATEPEEYGLNDYIWKYGDDELMLTINGEKITFDMFRHFVLYNKVYFDNDIPSYWNEETTKEYFDTIKEEFKYYAANKLLAQKNGCDLTSEDFAYIDQQMQELKDNYTLYYGAPFEDELASMFLTEKVYRQLVTYDFYTQNLIESKVGEEELDNYFKENYVTAQHVLISTVDEQNQPLPEEQIKEKEALATEVYNKAIAGEDFRTLIDTYGEDPGMTVQDSYTFTTGKMVAEFEEKSFELAEGEISEPVKTSFGYHIIKKLPLVPPEKDTEDWLIAVQSLGYEEYQAEIAEFMETLTVEETDAFKEITIENIGTLIPKHEEAVEDGDNASEDKAENEASSDNSVGNEVSDDTDKGGTDAE